jgi:predicted amidophosphoribosyltransferase
MNQVTFASCYVYSPGGNCAMSEQSRLLCTLLKAGNGCYIEKYAKRVARQTQEFAELRSFFEPDDVLVPVPGSDPRRAGAQSVTTHLTRALIDQGLGCRAWPGLRRARAVRKSATARTAHRPTVAAHYDSFAIDLALDTLCPAHIVLIDDVVTKGRTLLAAASRLSEACPHSRIRAFALLRTMGLIPEVNRLLEPCVGEITWRNGDAYRNP